MKHILLLLVVFSTIHSIGFSQQNQNSIQSSWDNLKIVFQRRLDIIKQIYMAVDKSSKDAKLCLEKAKAMSDDLWKYIDTLHADNAVSITRCANKNKLLRAKLSEAFVILEKNGGHNDNNALLDLTTQLEGTENRIAVAVQQYNNTCVKRKRADLHFDLGNSSPAPAVKF
ncbi:MAG: LemA family protein [Agriterribacter sp.]